MTTATVRQCVLLLDRPVADPQAPPPALRQCAGRPVLAWLMREFLRFGVEQFLLLSDGASGIEEQATALAGSLPRQPEISVAVSPNPGSTAALRAERSRLHQRFLLCRGDAVFDANLAPLLAAQTEPAAGHVLSPPAQVASFGVGVFDSRLLDLLPQDCPLSAAMPQLLLQRQLRALPLDGWFCDTASPAGLAIAQHEVAHRLHRPALLLDRDGVLNVDHGWVGSRDRFEWMPGALETLRYATQAGWHVFVVTNQSGVARGFYDEAAVRALLGWMREQAQLAGGTIDDTRFCPYHENATVEAYRRAHHWRKPQPGMLLDLIRAWQLDPARCIMVGDQPSDMQAADAAGVTGHLFPGGNLLDFVRPLLEAAQAGA